MGASSTYLSFDVANRSIAFSYVEFRRPAAADVAELERIEGALAQVDVTAAGAGAAIGALQAAATALDEKLRVCRVMRAGTTDLTRGRKVKQVPLVDRLEALHEFLTEQAPQPRDFPPGTEVLIELQMGPNFNSHEIESALTYHYVRAAARGEWPGGRVRTIPAALKNTIAPAPTGGERYHFIERYAKAYDANKAHALFNFNYLARAWAFEAAYAAPDCRRKHRKDSADSFMQALAVWLREGGDA